MNFLIYGFKEEKQVIVYPNSLAIAEIKQLLDIEDLLLLAGSCIFKKNDTRASITKVKITHYFESGFMDSSSVANNTYLLLTQYWSGHKLF